MTTAAQPLHVTVPAGGYHRGLISCQAACPVHTDARGYVRAIAEGRFEEAYLIARGPQSVRLDLRAHLRCALRSRLPARQGSSRR